MDQEVSIDIDDLFAPAEPKTHVYQSPANVAGGPAKVNYSHLDMIDYMIANPHVQQRDLAARYGYTQAWVSRIISSDAFRTMYAERRGALVDPVVAQELDERFRALAMRSLDVVMEKLEVNPTMEAGLKALDIAGRMAGYGVAKGASVNVNAQMTANVIVVPAKSKDVGEWMTEYKTLPSSP